VSALAGWPALVLAAGLGTRLRPLSDVRAKAALPVAGRPLIARILDRLGRTGIRRVVLNLHHLPESVTRIVGDGSGFGLEVRYSWERELLGSGGGPARAIPLLAADRFLIVNGDTLTDIDLEALATAHRASGALVTLAVAPADLTRYNAVMADSSNAVVGFARRTAPATPPPPAPLHPAPLHPAPVHPAPATPYHFIGIQAVSAAAFSGVATDRPSETVADLYPRLIAARPGSVRVFTQIQATEARSPDVRTTGGPRFFDIGTPADYFETVGRIAAEEQRALDCGEQCEIDRMASVQGSLIWDRVRIGAGATVIECIVADDVVIPPGARYHRQVITTHASGPIDR
jgi:NDP-sugar pyrophosphorylase family protein